MAIIAARSESATPLLAGTYGARVKAREFSRHVDASKPNLLNFLNWATHSPVQLQGNLFHVRKGSS